MKAKTISVSKKPKWADGAEFEVYPKPFRNPKRVHVVLRWEGWAHKFTFENPMDLFEAMDQVRALWFGYCPTDWDLIGAVHAQRFPFSLEAA